MLIYSTILAVFTTLSCAGATPAQAFASFTITSDWDVAIALPGIAVQTVHVQPPSLVTVAAERYAAVPVFDPKANGWSKGLQLTGVKAQETTSPRLLEPASFDLRAGPEPDSHIFAKGLDYELDSVWGTFGRLAGGQIRPDQPVFVSYRYSQMRLDAVVLTTAGRIVLRQGEPRAVAPAAPALSPGERSLGNIYLPGSSD